MNPRPERRFTIRRASRASLAAVSLARSLLIASAVSAALPAVAAAATLEATRSCYPNGTEARLAGSGFAPDSPIRFTVNGRRLKESVVSDSTGDVSVRYTPAHVAIERRLVIRATDEAGTSASETIYATPRLRVLTDSRGADDARTWTAVFRLYGFGRGRAYIHYVNPKGRLKKTVRLGRLRRPCGRLRTDRRRVMPFERPQFGFWKLQFDTRERYDKDTRRKRVIRVRIYRG